MLQLTGSTRGISTLHLWQKNLGIGVSCTAASAIADHWISLPHWLPLTNVVRDISSNLWLGTLTHRSHYSLWPKFVYNLCRDPNHSLQRYSLKSKIIHTLSNIYLLTNLTKQITLLRCESVEYGTYFTTFTTYCLHLHAYTRLFIIQ